MIRYAVLLSVLCATANAQICLRYMFRGQWGAMISTCSIQLTTPVMEVTIHQTDVEFCYTTPTCSVRIRSIQTQHIIVKKFCDIEHNFYIGEDGVVYEGRGWKIVGIYAEIHSISSISISFIGPFIDRAPSPEALEAAMKLIECGVGKNVIKEDYVLKIDSNIESTSSLYNVINKWPQFQP